MHGHHGAVGPIVAMIEVADGTVLKGAEGTFTDGAVVAETSGEIEDDNKLVDEWRGSRVLGILLWRAPSVFLWRTTQVRGDKMSRRAISHNTMPMVLSQCFSVQARVNPMSMWGVEGACTDA